MVKFGCTALGNLDDAINTINRCGLDCYEVAGERGSYPRYISNFSKSLNVPLSMHGCFYLSLTNPNKLSNNLTYVEKAIECAKLIGVDRIIFHAGCSNSNDRINDLRTVIKSLNHITSRVSMGNVKIAIENTGKKDLIGTVNEVIVIVKNTEHTIPCIDIGHDFSKSIGANKGYDHYCSLFECIDTCLGTEQLMNMHYHYSKQSYNDRGEIKHLNFSDACELEPNDFIRALKTLGSDCNSRVICESATDLVKDALTMKEMYLNL